MSFKDGLEGLDGITEITSLKKFLFMFLKFQLQICILIWKHIQKFKRLLTIHNIP